MVIGNATVKLQAGRERLTKDVITVADDEGNKTDVADVGKGSPWYGGASASVLATQQKYEYGKMVWDTGLIGGYHTSNWNLAANAFVSNGLNGLQHQSPDISFSTKLARRVTGTVWGGLELYFSKAKAMTVDGTVWGITKTLFGTLEFEGKKSYFSVGMGRGLNVDTDPWTLKCTFDTPL